MPTMVTVWHVDVSHFSFEAVLLYKQTIPFFFGLLRNTAAAVACCEINFINLLPIKRLDT